MAETGLGLDEQFCVSSQATSTPTSCATDGVEGYMFYTANRDFNGGVAPSYIKLATSPARHRN
jgi:hypothetical protein